VLWEALEWSGREGEEVDAARLYRAEVSVHARDLVDLQTFCHRDQGGVCGAQWEVAELAHRLDDPGQVLLVQGLLAEHPVAAGLHERDLGAGAGELLHQAGDLRHHVGGDH
jgi:hypothetical protein